MNPRSRWLIISAATLTLVFAGAGAANAGDNMVPTNTYDEYCIAQTMSTADRVCQTDNAGLSVYMESSVSTNMRSRIRDALDNSYNGTDLTVSYPSVPDYSGAGETDIIYQQGTLPGSGLAGITWCNDDVDSALYDCDQAYIRFTTDTYYEHRMTTCHETGHAVGLLHGAQAYPVVANDNTSVLGCLRTPYDQSAYLLGNNNATEINATY